MDEQKPPSSLLPALLLAALIAVLVGAWWLFPRFQASMARSNCEAAGHTNCV